MQVGLSVQITLLGPRAGKLKRGIVCNGNSRSNYFRSSRVIRTKIKPKRLQEQFEIT